MFEAMMSTEALAGSPEILIVEDDPSLRVLLSRTLRENGFSTTSRSAPRDIVRFQGWSVDLRRRELTSPQGAEVELSGAEFDLLNSFLDNPQRIIGRERLLELSRARLTDASDRSIDVLVSRL